MSHEVERAVRAANHQQRVEDEQLEEIYEELKGHYHMLEMIGLAVVRARNGDYEEGATHVQVPGFKVHGVQLYVDIEEVKAAHPPDDGPAPPEPDEPKIILPH